MFLKQSTAVTIVLPRFVDSTDGNTAETALTISQSDVRLSKNGAAFAQKGDATSCTHMENGFYSCPLSTTDTGTLGLLKVAVAESGALSVEQTYIVLPANTYDSWVSGTDLVDVSLVQINGSTTPVTNMAASALAIVTGTSDNTGFTATSTIFDSTITEATADHFNGRVVVFTSGALLGQAGLISDYALTSGRGRFTISSALTEAVPNTTSFVIV